MWGSVVNNCTPPFANKATATPEAKAIHDFAASPSCLKPISPSQSVRAPLL